MELRKTKSFGVLNDHQRSIRDVDAYLDDRCRNKDVQFAGDELAHDLVFLCGLHLSVQKADTEPGEYFVAKLLIHFGRGLEVDLFGFLDQRVHDIHLTSALDLASDSAIYAVALILTNHDGLNRCPARRQL